MKTTLSKPEEYDNLTEVHYYEIQHSGIPLYSDSSDIYIYIYIYMEEISLPPSSSLHIFEENTHSECPQIYDVLAERRR